MLPSSRPDVAQATSRWVSIALHPFATALLLAGIVELRRGTASAARAVGSVLLFLVLPLGILMWRQTRSSRWGTVDASQPRERPVLYAVGVLGVALLFGFLARTQPASPLLHGMIGIVAMLAVCAAMTAWIKVSLHLATAALAAAVLIGIRSPMGWLLLALLPLLAWSRVSLGRHRWAEVALGGAIGVVTGVLITRVG